MKKSLGILAFLALCAAIVALQGDTLFDKVKDLLGDKPPPLEKDHGPFRIGVMARKDVPVRAVARWLPGGERARILGFPLEDGEGLASERVTDLISRMDPEEAIPLIRWEMGMPAEGAVPERSRVRGLVDAILRGDHDDALGAAADACRDWGHPMYLQLLPRTLTAIARHYPVEGPWLEKAWEHAYAIFRDHGACNVAWVWTVPRDAPVMHFPDEKVHWMAVEDCLLLGDDEDEEVLEEIAEDLDFTLRPVMVFLHRESTPRMDRLRQALEAPHRIRSVMLPARETEDPEERILSYERVTPLRRDPFPRSERRLRPSGGTFVSIIGESPPYALYVGGKPFYIRGIAYGINQDWRDPTKALTAKALDDDFRSIRALGANTVRRYGTTRWYDRNVLDAAERADLKVIFGVWLPQDVNYLTDSEKRQEVLARIRSTLEEHRDHPALLGWGIGNEVWGLLKHRFMRPYLTEIRIAYCRYLNEVANLIREVDPNHPMMTALEHSDELLGALRDIQRFAPDVDIIGVNSYCEPDISALGDICARARLGRPYLVSEFGPDGYWHDTHSPYDEFGELLECSDEIKADSYARRWRDYIEARSRENVGGVAYTWQDRLEGTLTYFGLNDQEGRRKASFWALGEAWGGEPCSDRPPVIESLSLDDRYLDPGEETAFHLSVRDPEGEETRVEIDTRTIDMMQKIPACSRHGSGYRLRAPREPGMYRIHVWASDPAGGVSTGSITFRVEDPDHR